MPTPPPKHTHTHTHKERKICVGVSVHICVFQLCPLRRSKAMTLQPWWAPRFQILVSKHHFLRHDWYQIYGFMNDPSLSWLSFSTWSFLLSPLQIYLLPSRCKADIPRSEFLKLWFFFIPLYNFFLSKPIHAWRYKSGTLEVFSFQLQFLIRAP